MYVNPAAQKTRVALTDTDARGGVEVVNVVGVAVEIVNEDVEVVNDDGLTTRISLKKNLSMKMKPRWKEVTSNLWLKILYRLAVFIHY